MSTRGIDSILKHEIAARREGWIYLAAFAAAVTVVLAALVVAM